MGQKNHDEEEEKKSSESSSYKYLLLFLGGLAAGVALGMYLNSKQGKKVRKQVKRKMSALELEIEDKVDAAMEEINRLAEKGGFKPTKEGEEDNKQ